MTFGLMWAATAILIWSGSLILLRLGVTTGLTAYDLTALRFGVAATLLLPVLVRGGIATDGPGLVGVLAMVALFGAPYVLLLSLAVKTAPAAAAGALNPGVMAIASVLLGRVRHAQRINPARWLGIGLTLAGIAAFVGTAGGLATGHFVLFATGLMWAAFAAFVRARRVPALRATALIAVGSAVLYLPVYLLALPVGILHAKPADVLLQAVFQGVLVTTVAVYAFGRSAELLGAEVGTSLPALIPAVTLALDTFVMGDTPRPWDVAAACLVTVGIALILLRARRRPGSKN
ncbi:DMT family transporter [Burkholderia sp. 22PA0099]|uniref:DMT family transporter n=1 Tax=Burkholderia sp. 22PA0099 TaxID=3237372 RepID=UPI0039C2EB0E